MGDSEKAGRRRRFSRRKRRIGWVELSGEGPGRSGGLRYPDVGVSINKDAQPDKRSYKVSFGLFRRLAPDHQPQLDLRRSIEDLRDGLESMGFKDSDFRNSDYMRLKVLSKHLNKGLLDKDLKWTRG